MTWRSSTLVYGSGGLFDPWEAEQCILIGRRGVALD
jgi:hypothetical protein